MIDSSPTRRVAKKVAVVLVSVAKRVPCRASKAKARGSGKSPNRILEAFDLGDVRCGKEDDELSESRTVPRHRASCFLSVFKNLLAAHRLTQQWFNLDGRGGETNEKTTY